MALDGPLCLYGQPLSSRLLLGSALYPSPDDLCQAVRVSQASMLTLSLRREQAGQGDGGQFFALIKQLNIPLLPNTAGCRTVEEAVTTAQMAREIFATDWIKLEIIGHDATLQPDVLGLVKAAEILIKQGFRVLPYTTEDIIVGQRLLDVGCQVLMPWGAPIGSARGLNNPYGLGMMRQALPDIPLIIDAGLGLPSHAAAAMEMGFDGILLNTAVARAGDPVLMAEGFAKAVQAGRAAFCAQPMPAQSMAQASSPEFGTPFSPWQQVEA